MRVDKIFKVISRAVRAVGTLLSVRIPVDHVNGL